MNRTRASFFLICGPAFLELGFGKMNEVGRLGHMTEHLLDPLSSCLFISWRFVLGHCLSESQMMFSVRYTRCILVSWRSLQPLNVFKCFWIDGKGYWITHKPSQYPSALRQAARMQPLIPDPTLKDSAVRPRLRKFRGISRLLSEPNALSNLTIWLSGDSSCDFLAALLTTKT